MMKISKEVIKWLNENAYALKNNEWYFLPDFPKDERPRCLEIPVNKKLWKSITQEETK